MLCWTQTEVYAELIPAENYTLCWSQSSDVGGVLAAQKMCWVAHNEHSYDVLVTAQTYWGMTSGVANMAP